MSRQRITTEQVWQLVADAAHSPLSRAQVIEQLTLALRRQLQYLAYREQRGRHTAYDEVAKSDRGGARTSDPAARKRRGEPPMNEQEAIHQAAIAWLEAHASYLSADLLASAIAIMPTMPTRLEGLPYCRACESPLCGVCGQCHSLALVPWAGICRADQDMSADCAAWWLAFNAVFIIARQQKEAEQ